MKNKRNFIAELRTLEMPYSKYFTKKGLRNALFAQYLHTELKPNLKLYFNSHISQKEWKDGLAETHLDIPENTTASRNEKVAANVVSLTEIESKAQDIQSAFFALVWNNKLPSEYYTHTITDTPIFHILVAVKQQIADFQEGVFEEMELNPKEYGESFTEKLIDNLKQIQIPELSNAVIKDFISEEENIQFDIRIILGENVPSDISLFYKKTKQFADNSLSRYLEQKPQQVQQDNSKAEGETETTLNLKDEIEGYFYYLQFDDFRKHKKILSDDDFERLVGWIEDYYKNGLEVPKIKNPIKEVNTAKGNVIETFRNFYKYKNPYSTYPDSLWQFIKTAFFQYREDTLLNISKAKKSNDYDTLINKYKNNIPSVNS